MSALTAAPPAATRRPVPWPRLAWVSWRRHRTALAAAAGLLAAVAGLAFSQLLSWYYQPFLTQRRCWCTSPGPRPAACPGRWTAGGRGPAATG